MSRGRKRKQSEASGCIVCSDDEENIAPEQESSQRTDCSSDSEPESRMEESVALSIEDNYDNNDEETGQSGCGEKENDSSCEDEEVILRPSGTNSQRPKMRGRRLESKRGNYAKSINETSSNDMRGMMTEMIAKFQDSQKDLMQMILSTTNRNSEDLKSSMQALTSHIRDTQTLLVELKEARRHSNSEENGHDMISVKSQAMTGFDGRSEQNRAEDNTEMVTNAERHYGSKFCTTPLSPSNNRLVRHAHTSNKGTRTNEEYTLQKQIRPTSRSRDRTASQAPPKEFIALPLSRDIKGTAKADRMTENSNQHGHNSLVTSGTRSAEGESISVLPGNMKSRDMGRHYRSIVSEDPVCIEDTMHTDTCVENDIRQNVNMHNSSMGRHYRCSHSEDQTENTNTSQHSKTNNTAEQSLNVHTRSTDRHYRNSLAENLTSIESSTKQIPLQYIDKSESYDGLCEYSSKEYVSAARMSAHNTITNSRPQIQEQQAKQSTLLGNGSISCHYGVYNLKNSKDIPRAETGIQPQIDTQTVHMHNSSMDRHYGSTMSETLHAPYTATHQSINDSETLSKHLHAREGNPATDRNNIGRHSGDRNAPQEDR